MPKGNVKAFLERQRFGKDLRLNGKKVLDSTKTVSSLSKAAGPEDALGNQVNRLTVNFEWKKEGFKVT